MSRGGFFARLQREMRKAQKEQERRAREATRHHSALVRQHERTLREEERAHALYLKASAADKKRLEKAAREARIELPQLS